MPVENIRQHLYCIVINPAIDAQRVIVVYLMCLMLGVQSQQWTLLCVTFTRSSARQLLLGHVLSAKLFVHQVHDCRKPTVCT